MRTLPLVVLAIVAGVASSSPWVQEGIDVTQGPGHLGQMDGAKAAAHNVMQCIRKVTGKSISELLRYSLISSLLPK